MRVCQTCGKQDERSDEALAGAGWKLPRSVKSGVWLQELSTACPGCRQLKRLYRKDRLGTYRLRGR